MNYYISLKNIDEMKAFDQKKIFNNITDKKNIMEFIYLIIKALFEVINDNNDIARLIIIDNIYNNDKYVIKFLDSIINFINTYFNKKFIESYKKFHVTNNKTFKDNEYDEFLCLFYGDKNSINNYIKAKEKKKI